MTAAVAHMLGNSGALADDFAAILGTRTTHGKMLVPGTVALLGDSLVMLAFQNINPDGGVYENGSTFTIVDSGSAPHALLEGGRAFGFRADLPGAVATRTLTARTDGSNGSGPTTYNGAAGTHFANLQRMLDWGSWVPEWLALTGARVDLVPAGIGGATALDLDAWITSQVVPSGAETVFLSAGYIDAGYGGIPSATVNPVIGAAVSRLLAEGRRVLVQTMPPFVTAGPERTNIEAVNTYIRALTPHPRLRILDLYDVVDDGAGGQGANMIEDTIHPSALGCRAIALVAQTLLADWFPPREQLSTTHTRGRLATNPLMTGTGGTRDTGTWTGTAVADNWTVAGGVSALMGATLSKETRADGHGENQVFTSFVGKAAGRFVTMTSANASSQFTAGQTVYGIAEVSIASMADMRSLTLRLNVTDTDAAQANAATSGYADVVHTVATVSQADRTILMRTAPITLTNSVTNLQLCVNVIWGGTNNAGSLRIGRADIVRVG